MVRILVMMIKIMKMNMMIKIMMIILKNAHQAMSEMRS